MKKQGWSGQSLRGFSDVSGTLTSNPGPPVLSPGLCLLRQGFPDLVFRPPLSKSVQETQTPGPTPDLENRNL